MTGIASGPPPGATTIHDAIVLGSGPAGVAAAAALIGEGVRPLVIDGGVIPEREAIDRQSALRSGREPEPGQARTQGGSGGKTWFGSDAPYRQPVTAGIGYDAGVLARASFGPGGLSRTWGATFAFYDDFGLWPRDARPSAADFDAVRRLVPASTTCWDGEQAEGATVAGAEVSARLYRAVRDDPGLGSGWEARPSTLAIDTRPGSPNGCSACRRCLGGCPTDSIWCAADTLSEWVAEDRIAYSSGVVARSMSERDGTVELAGVDRAGRSVNFVAKRLFVGAGAISTASLLVASGVASTLVLRDTATAFLAAFDRRGAGAGPGGGHHDLSQWWLARRGASLLMAQFYAPSKHHASQLQGRLPIGPASEPVASWLARRLHPVIAYLDTDSSDSLMVRSEGRGARVIPIERPETKAEFLRQLRPLRSLLFRHGYLLPLALADLSPPGTGYHFGASLPHGRGSDSLGRPPGFDRIHVVDASVLPRIELGSITPTVMANATRIARTASNMETT